ncbi:hypothetical protein [Streptomyces fulvoviolaceus]|uniref:hypothetical protein n=1 Tax=Streptomyces fulvoviolaceus TaxID=285535 RepID=UPI0004C75280|nr:hypothetical protein [Streptomyces fulvoviolaceus]
MGTIVISGTVVLVVLGFGNHTWWLVAVAVLFLYVQYGRGMSSSGGSGGMSSGGSAGGSSGGSGGAVPGNYRAYRDRREKQAKWDRRYRREHPFESRRQQRSK